MGIHPQLANVDLAVYGDLAVGRVVILNNPPALSALLVNRRNQIGRYLSCAHTIFQFFRVTRIQFARSDEERRCAPVHVLSPDKKPSPHLWHLLDLQRGSTGVVIVETGFKRM